MSLPAQLDPPAWRDEDRATRVIAQPPPNGLCAALHASFDVQPLPREVLDLIARLR